MKFDLSDSEIQFALRSVQRAALLVKKIQRELGPIAHLKHDRSPVTVGDFAVQAYIGAELQKYFREDALVAEESAEMLVMPENQGVLSQVSGYVRDVIPDATPKKICEWIDLGKAEPANRFWTLDPIDGTRGFLRGDQYVVALALIENGKVKLGVIACPNLKDGRIPDVGGRGSLVIGARNQGAWCAVLEGTIESSAFLPLKVSAQEIPAQARIISSVESGHTNANELSGLIERLKIQTPVQSMDSQAKHVVVASGGADLFFRFLSPKKPGYREKIWDQAAGTLIVEEAGGRVSDLTGQPFDFSQGRTLDANYGVAVSNGRLHAAAVEAIKAGAYH